MWTCFLNTTPKFNEGYFLEGSSQHGILNHIEEHFILQYIQIPGAILNLKGSFTYERFCAVIHRSFGKCWLSGLGILPNGDTLIVRYHKITLVVREVCKYQAVVWLMALDTRFPKFCFPLENSNLIIGNHSCFPDHSVHLFLKKYLSDTQV